MNGKKGVLLFLLLFLGIFLVLRILHSEQARELVRIALPDENGNWHRIQTEIPTLASQENLEKAMSYLSAGFPELGLLPALPEGAAYYSIFVRDEGLLEINFKQGYLQSSDLQRGLCEAAMMHTFADFSGINRMYLYEEGIPLSSLNRNSVFGRTKEEAYLSFADSVSQEITEMETLFLFESRKGKLVEVKKAISRPVYEGRGKALLLALQREAEQEGKTGLLDAGIGINAVRIRAQVCYVDFDQEFVKAYSEMGANKNYLIYSIVNSLTSMDNVEYVQFLINGENPEKYNETKALKGMYRKNLVYVEAL